MRLEAPERSGPLTEYPEADLIVYRIPDPLGFLKTQKNLHRIQVKGDYRGEGLSNALRYVWDSAYKKSRLAWQRIFSETIRKMSQGSSLRSRKTKRRGDPQKGFD